MEDTTVEGHALDDSVQAALVRKEALNMAYEAHGDSEDAATACLDDIVDDIFAEMRVLEENAQCLNIVTQFIWVQMLDGCVLSGKKPPETLDVSMKEVMARGQRQELRPLHDEEVDEAKAQLTTPKTRSLWNEPYATVIPFLSTMWTHVEGRRSRIERHLARFRRSYYHLSAVPSVGQQGAWEIPSEDLAPFLSHVIKYEHLSVLPSAVDVVISRNATLLEKKRKARRPLQLDQIELCIQSALLTAEEEMAKRSIDETPRGAISFLQTELLSDNKIHRNILVCYSVGDEPAAPTIDRNAPGYVDTKTISAAKAASKHKLARDVVRMLRSTSPVTKNSKWGSLRTKMVVSDEHVGVSVEADVSMHVGDTKTAVKKFSALALAAAAKPSSPTKVIPPPKLSTDLDTATLSNIFSLGTPRQLSVDELARRNDILAMLEREEAQATRKMAVATITAVRVPMALDNEGKLVASEHDKAFQEYTAANSTVVMTGETCIPSVVLAQEGGERRSKRKSDKARGSGDASTKTKFDLTLEPPDFDVVDGSATAKHHPHAITHIPGKRSKSRGVKSQAGHTATISLHPSPPISTIGQHNQPHRPLDTPTGQLPQLDTSRLAMGVKAVVRGVEKRGPRPSPSRNSRLKMHNYTGENEHITRVPSPPSRSDLDNGLISSNRRTPDNHLPPVSPVKNKPTAKHVTFNQSQPLSPPRELSPAKVSAADIASPMRRFPAKQPTWEKRTSPPRIRNRHFTDSSPTKRVKVQLNYYLDMDDQQVIDVPKMSPQPPNAPRRNLVYRDDDL